jgi:hypothetical protein
MAYISNQWCEKCRSDKEHINNKCVTCAVVEVKEKRTIWNSKTDSEKIEELLRRIEKLENANIKYA